MWRLLLLGTYPSGVHRGNPGLSTTNTMSTDKQSLFVTDDGRNLVFTFILVSSLFLLWGVCNGMIDVMDKHFQTELSLSKAQSAWVQFAHYLGYFLMALPAGWAATRLGYKGGIIAGLLMVAAGGFWFLPATRINAMAQAGSVSPTTAFIGYLAGVCAIAAGLTFLETIANPYTTVLGAKRYAATRINLAQSCNGVGWICGPIIGGVFFYSTDAAGRSTGSETLYIPYIIVGGVVLALAVVFYLAYIPDIKTEDDYHLDDSTPNVSHHIWTHPHFVLAVAAQFLYVAAQAGIFSFLINYMTEEVPAIPASWQAATTKNWIEIKTRVTKHDIRDLPALADKLQRKPDAVSAFLSSQLSDSTLSALDDYKDSASNPNALLTRLVQDLNEIVRRDPKNRKNQPMLYDPQRFSGVVLREKTRQLLVQQPQGASLARLNRLLLEDAYPGVLAYDDGILGFSDQAASLLASVGFVCFLIGRFTGAGLLKSFSAHKTLGLYGVLNVIACLLVFLKLGWLSVGCVFLSYFFMSIMFPTIFALGIFGLGARAKKASAFIVMAIMGGAILPKVMGRVADLYDMSRGFIVPMVCFVFIAAYGFLWPKLSNAESLHALPTSGGH
jgi:fucose permease